MVEDIFKAIGYAILFGLVGLIIGIWVANIVYILFLKNMSNITTTRISLIIISIVIIAGIIIGLTKGKRLT